MNLHFFKLANYFSLLTFGAINCFLFFNFSPDLDQYLHLAYNTDLIYFEPFWYLLFTVLQLISSENIIFLGAILFIIYQAIIFSIVYKCSNQLSSKKIFLMVLILYSFTIGGLLGSYRQTIAELIAIYVIIFTTNKRFNVLTTIIFHWINSLIIVLYANVKYIVPIALILTAYAWFNLDLLENMSFLQRITYYTNNSDFSESYNSVQYLSIALLKTFTIFLFVINIAIIRRESNSSNEFYLLLLSPLLQLGILLITGDTLIVQRVGGVFDIFVFIGIYYILKNTKYPFILLMPYLLKYLYFITSFTY